MTVLALEQDHIEVRRGTRSGMTISVVLHALLLLWIVTQKPPQAIRTALTEVSFIDAADAGGGTPAAPAAAKTPVAVPGALAPADRDVRFHRVATAETRPTPQSDLTLDDRIQTRLAALQRQPALVATAGASGGPALAEAPAPAGLGGSGGSTPLSLSRGGGTAAPSLSLTRGGGSGSAPALAVPGSAVAAPPSARDVPGGGDTGARRSVAGAMLAGPIADRPVLSMVTPTYPEWAKRDAVEGAVTLYFIVRPDGSVKENVLVQKTAGFQEFDDNAVGALKQWRFEPLHGGRTGEQWGTITFHFRLRDAA